MTTNISTNDLRDLSIDELDEVSGGFRISFGGLSLDFSPERSGIAVTLEGKGGVSVSAGGISMIDGKKNITSASWDDILGGGKK